MAVTFVHLPGGIDDLKYRMLASAVGKVNQCRHHSRLRFCVPWCYIGFKRLSRAIDSLSDDLRWSIGWLPFELNPELQVCGVDRVS
jgi:hypothetical protein